MVERGPASTDSSSWVVSGPVPHDAHFARATGVVTSLPRLRWRQCVTSRNTSACLRWCGAWSTRRPLSLRREMKVSEITAACRGTVFCIGWLSRTSTISVLQGRSQGVARVNKATPYPLTPIPSEKKIIRQNNLFYLQFTVHIKLHSELQWRWNALNVLYTTYTTLFHQSGSNRQKIEKNLTK